MPKASVNDDSKTLYDDILGRRPDGCRMDRRTFDALIVRGFNKSKEAADRITKAGELLGYWTRGYSDLGMRNGWVDVHPLQTQEPAIVVLAVATRK